MTEIIQLDQEEQRITSDLAEELDLSMDEAAQRIFELGLMDLLESTAPTTMAVKRLLRGSI